MPEIDPNIYLEAAERIDARQNDYSCNAIGSALCVAHDVSSIWLLKDTADYFKPYYEFFAPGGDPEDEALAREIGHPFWLLSTGEALDCKTLALLFMHEIAKGLS